MNEFESQNETENKAIEHEIREKPVSLREALLSTWRKWPMRLRLGAGAGGVLLLAVVALFLGASLSMPGGALYSLKTGVVERVFGVLQIGAENKVAYHTSRMETRLNELKRLHARETVDEVALVAARDAVAENSVAFTAALGEAKSAGLAPKDELVRMNEFVSLTLAQERIAERDSRFTQIEEYIEELRRDTENAFEDEAEIFAETQSPAILTEYLTEVLTTVQRDIADNTLRGDARGDVDRMLGQANAALGKGNLLRAFTISSEMARIIMAERHLAGVEFEKQVSVPGNSVTSSTTEATPQNAATGTATSTE